MGRRAGVCWLPLASPEHGRAEGQPLPFPSPTGCTPPHPTHGPVGEQREDTFQPRGRTGWRGAARAGLGPAEPSPQSRARAPAQDPRGDRLAAPAQTSVPEAARCDRQVPGPFLGPTGLIAVGSKRRADRAEPGPGPDGARVCRMPLPGRVPQPHGGPAQQHCRHRRRLTDEDAEAK